MLLIKKVLMLTSVLFSIVFSLGCTPQEQVELSATVISDGDECHVCGMLINRLPGPKAQAIFDKQHVKFCSTRDMVSFLQDEENTHRVFQIFVHNMAGNNWQTPSQTSYIDGRKAWYVEGSSKSGGMGPTFASFLNEGDAHKFAQEFGGEVKKLTQLGQQTPAMQMGHSH